ncbi:hypothetical protein [Pseudodonghicola xiamenensis]|uniref:Uncharacterized protein n=1 Tax=Pseudodonghicola xiamenensis TaxID=337702 RepID=A0A8J3HBD0_9RHOB|nr:hypothetical protein [Pseudodonghicola xiamenensis]GHG99595.1 hypothetical protein GCM10010961_35580 [Pseudodonghicola xiamenensis]
MKIEVTRKQSGIDCDIRMQHRNAQPATAPAGARAIMPNEVDFAPPLAPLAMPKQQIEAVEGRGRRWLPGSGRRMQGQP